MIDNLTAAVIAGGKSRRFGEPKSGALLGKKTMLDYAISLAGKIAPEVRLSVGNNQLAGAPGIPRIVDIYPDCGPLGGIYSVLKAAETPWVAMLPCDMPLLEPSVYKLMLSRRETNRPVAAISPKGLEPLVSIWPKSLLAALHAALEKKEFAIYKVMETLNPVKVAMAEQLPGFRREMFYNVNRKEDLAELKQLIRL